MSLPVKDSAKDLVLAAQAIRLIPRSRDRSLAESAGRSPPPPSQADSGKDLVLPAQAIRPVPRSRGRSLAESPGRSPPPPSHSNEPDLADRSRVRRRSPTLPRSRTAPPAARRLMVDDSGHWLTNATFVPRATRLQLLRKFPHFDQLHNESFMQQDAILKWTRYLYTLSDILKPSRSREIPDTVEALFGVDLVTRVNCAESGEEFSKPETVYSLKCHISQEVKHLHDGLTNGLKCELEINSPVLGRNAVFLKESHINGLPRYLTIQFVRIFWKSASNEKVKNLQKVDYPLELDVYDLCSEDLRKALEVCRQGASIGSGGTSNAISNEGVHLVKGAQMTGVYDLVAVLTLKGDGASGHHVAWIKKESGDWIKCHNPIRKEEAKFSGGGDWHMAYICLYKARGLQS